MVSMWFALRQVQDNVRRKANVGGAGRVRTAASQFCRLLPYHLGTAPREGGIIVVSIS